MHQMFVMIMLPGFLNMAFIPVPMSSAYETAINHTEHLLYDLLLDYNMYVRPVSHANKSLNVSVVLHLISMKQYDEMKGTLSFIAILGMEWIDTRMVWDPLLYGGVNYITVGYDKVWVPDLYCVNSATNFLPVGTNKERIGFYAVGYAVFAPGALFTVSCEGNMEKYPFDSQTCHISFNAWNYRKGEVVLVPVSNVINVDSIESNNMWAVVNTRVGNILNPDGVQLDFFMEIKRKSKFVTVNVVVPLVFLSCLNNLVFLLIPEAGERISLCITVLLSISVYLTILNHTLPQSSEPVPLISYKILADLVVSYLIMLMVVINLRLYNKGADEKVPQNVKAVYKILTCTCKKVNRLKPTSFQDCSRDFVEKLEKSEENTDQSENKATFKDDVANDNITWRDISAIVDLCCFILFNFLTICSCYVFLKNTYV